MKVNSTQVNEQMGHPVVTLIILVEMQSVNLLSTLVVQYTRMNSHACEQYVLALSGIKRDPFPSVLLCIMHLSSFATILIGIQAGGQASRSKFHSKALGRHALWLHQMLHGLAQSKSSRTALSCNRQAQAEVDGVTMRVYPTPRRKRKKGDKIHLE